MADNNSNKLVTDNLGYVVSIAKEYQNRGLSMDDLVSEGTIGMIEASRKFDATRGKRFVSYANGFIRSAIERAINEQASLYKVPRKEEESVRKQPQKALSVDQPLPIGSHNAFNLLHVLEDKNAIQADDELIENGISDELQWALNRLDEREKTIVSAFFGIGCPRQTMMEIAQANGLKRERVRQIRDKALRKMRKMARRQGTLNDSLKK